MKSLRFKRQQTGSHVGCRYCMYNENHLWNTNVLAMMSSESHQYDQYYIMKLIHFYWLVTLWLADILRQETSWPSSCKYWSRLIYPKILSFMKIYLSTAICRNYDFLTHISSIYQIYQKLWGIIANIFFRKY